MPRQGSGFLFNRLAILGPGLLGGSIGLAVRKLKIAREVIVWGRRPEICRAAVRRKAAHRHAPTPSDAVSHADMVILCTPVGTMPKLAQEFRSHLKKGAIVTDVGSTKYDVVKQLSALIGKKGIFIGSHPMAGSEKDGLQAAKADLFKNAVCILTPLPRTPSRPLQKLVDFWQALGCHTRTTSPTEHDEIVSLISHLPHLTAAAMVNMVNRRNPRALDFIGNGFRDMTRIASGPAEMWTEIVMSNREEIRRAVDQLIEELETIRRDVINHSDLDLRAYLRRARQQREELTHRF